MPARRVTVVCELDYISTLHPSTQCAPMYTHITKITTEKNGGNGKAREAHDPINSWYAYYSLTGIFMCKNELNYTINSKYIVGNIRTFIECSDIILCINKSLYIKMWVHRKWISCLTRLKNVRRTGILIGEWWAGECSVVSMWKNFQASYYLTGLMSRSKWPTTFIDKYAARVCSRHVWKKYIG